MSTIGQPIDWLDRFSDRINPVLVREVRQVVKSRGFVASFLLMLAVCWLMLMYAIVQIGDGFAYGDPGRPLFGVFTGLLNLALCLIVPLSVFHCMAAEFVDEAFESLIVTTLSAERIVWGKLQTAFLQMAAYYSAGAPFLTFAYLAGGVGMLDVLIALILSFLASLAVCLAALLMGSLCRYAFFRLTGRAFVFCFGGICALFAFSVSVAAIGRNFSFWGDLAGGVFCVAIFMFFLGIISLSVAIAQFTPIVPLEYRERVAPNGPGSEDLGLPPGDQHLPNTN